MLHHCIKPTCGKEYKDNDEEAYYCPSCLEERKAIAAKLDQQFATRGRKEVSSDLKEFEASARVFKDQNGREIYFARA